MKRHSLSSEISIFSLFFLVYIVPPLIFQFKTETNFTNWTFNPSLLISLAVSIFILLFFYEKHKFSNILVRIILPSTFILSILFCFSLFFKFFAEITPESSLNLKTKVELPAKFIQWFFCIVQFLIAAFYEEVMYRYYLPETLSLYAKNKTWKIIFEFIVLLLFASAHLYLGLFAFLNAFTAHIVLRLSYKKTKSLIPQIAAHFLYNIISLILL